MFSDAIKAAPSFGSMGRKSAVSPTHRTIEQLHASLGVPPEAAIRPTEAQLRWAQFQSQKRAKETQHKIKKLYSFPASALDVRGVILGEDDASSSSSSSLYTEGDDQSLSAGASHPPVRSILIKRKSGYTNGQQQLQPHHVDLIFPGKKPKISKGRRALLKVSAREYLLRKEKSKQTLAIQPSSTTDTSDDMVTAPQHDELAHASLTPNPMQSTPTRRRRARMSGRVRNKVFSHVQNGAEAEEERVRRFEEAFHAITIGLSSSTLSGDSQTIAATTTKRWTRQSSESSTVDYNSVSRFGSIAHPHALVGVPTIVLQRRKQRHVQGIDLEHTDSWIRYMQSQQSASDTIDVEQEHSTSIAIQQQGKTYPGEQEFAKLRERLQYSCRIHAERIVPEAYKNTFPHRKKQNAPETLTKLNEDEENEPSIGNLGQTVPIALATSPRYSPRIIASSNALEVQLKALPVKPPNSERNYNLFCEKILKEISGEEQKPVAVPPYRPDLDFTQEYLKRWKQTHDKNSATYSISLNTGQDNLTFPNGDVKDKDQFVSKVVNCSPQPRKTERRIHDRGPSGHKVLSLGDNLQTEVLQTPEMIKRWHELNGKILNDFESVAMSHTDIGEEEYHQRILVQPSHVPSLVLTPSLLTKRLRQCIDIIKNYEWEKASYLINANPWLVEMTDVLSGQMLLHVLALYGGTAPERLNSELVNACPSSAHKFDEAGNLGLHLAAESGNVPMIRLLGDIFPGGASVQNVNGLLPLHLSVLSGMAEAVSEVASLFPGATAIQDNEGNLPLHLTSTLRGDTALPIVRILLQYDTPVRLQNNFLRNFSNDADFASFDESDFDFPTSPKYVETGVVLNNDRSNPLIMAVRSMLGWEVIEALLQGPGGEQAALECSSTGENALHLAASGRYSDPSVVLTLLKFVKDIATVPNGDGILPIELVCMQNMPEEVILALVLIDLRFDIQCKRTVVRTGYGKNWWFLVCDCNDEYHVVVEKVLLKCNHYEAIALCFMEGGNSSNKWTVISRATPKCKRELQKFLRFAGRYEFDGEPNLFDSDEGIAVYDAFDFGSYNEQRKEKKKVTVRCFTKEQPYKDEIHLLRDKNLDVFFLEEVAFFEFDELHSSLASHELFKFCIAIEKPRLTLGTLVEKVSKISDWRKDASAYCRYMNKVCGVLRKVAKALLHLHSQNVVHGCLSLDTVGKFDDNWKLMSVIHLREMGTVFPLNAINRNSPPEAVRLIQDDRYEYNSLRKNRSALHDPIIAEPSLDIWSFGKLFFEALSADSLFPYSHSVKLSKDFQTLETLGGWNDDDLKRVTSKLLHIGVTTLGVDLVKQCLQPKKSDRPQRMDQILRHDFWKELKAVSGQRKS